MTTEDNQQAWKRAREHTQAGKSGLTFAMFKADALDPALAALDASSRNIAYSTGFAYDRWRKGINCLLLKKPGNFWVKKLRTILLLEADFNMNNKKLSRDVMWAAELAGIIPPENYGGRKKHRSIELSLNYRLTCDILRQKRKAAILASTDAQGCFDRIVHAIAFLCLRRLGLPSAPIQSMITAIQTMTHYIRTGFGDSDDCYGYDPSLPPLMGLLQGNGAAGTGWTAISSVIVDMMKSAGFGLDLWSAISREAIRLVCFNFVDDSSLMLGGPTNYTSGRDIYNRMQPMLDLWESALRATGGAVAHEKSYWHLVDFYWKDGAWRYRKVSDIPGDLTLPQGDDRTPTPIQRLEVTEAKELLGLMIRPDSNESDQFDSLLAKARKWRDAIRTRKVNRHDAWYAMNHTIMRTMEFPLMATTLTRQECKALMTPILLGGLPPSGVQRHMPRALVHGSNAVQGMSVPHLHATQTIQHLQAICRHGTRSTATGVLLRNTMQGLQLELGSGTPFWDLPHPVWKPLATYSWISCTWEALHETPLRVKGPLSPPPLKRTHDVYLMDHLMALDVPDTDLIRLNNFRMRMKVYCLSDIVTADGFRIRNDAWLGRPLTRPSVHDWPKTFRPTPEDSTKWQSFLRSFLPPHASHRRLLQPLGPWFDKTDQHWIWWFSPSRNLVFQNTANGWTKWTPTQRHFRCSGQVGTPLPDDLVRADVKGSRHSQHITLKSHHPQLFPPPLNPADPNPTVQALIDRLPPTLKWALCRVHIPQNGTLLAAAIMAAEAVLVSDASLKDLFGTASIVLEGATSFGRAKAVNITPGPIKEGDSYRCELAGIIGGVLLVILICECHHLTTGTVLVACDNINTLRIFEPSFVPEPTQESFDLVCCLHHLIKSVSITFTPEHVRGHQADKKPKSRLTRLEALNDEMDNIAKAFWNHLLSTGHNMQAPHLHVEHEGWSVWNQTAKLSQVHKTHCVPFWKTTTPLNFGHPLMKSKPNPASSPLPFMLLIGMHPKTSCRPCNFMIAAALPSMLLKIVALASH